MYLLCIFTLSQTEREKNYKRICVYQSLETIVYGGCCSRLSHLFINSQEAGVHGERPLPTVVGVRQDGQGGGHKKDSMKAHLNSADLSQHVSAGDKWWGRH